MRRSTQNIDKSFSVVKRQQVLTRSFCKGTFTVRCKLTERPYIVSSLLRRRLSECHGGALRDIPEEGCEGDYPCSSAI